VHHALEEIGRQGIASLVEMSFTAIEQSAELMDLAGEQYHDDDDDHYASAQNAADAQEALRKAAIHLWEVENVREKMPKTFARCDFMIEYLTDLYTIEHHLEKTWKYLNKSIPRATTLAHRLNESLKIILKYQLQEREEI
jgi:hypothetical protein